MYFLGVHHNIECKESGIRAAIVCTEIPYTFHDTARLPVAQKNQ
jgi:hypothetical protein